jgi:RNA polymerase sigma factor for flagellar operon FliA
VHPHRAVDAHLPLVRKIAAEVKRMLGSAIEFDDLMAYGTQGLLEANERYDASRGIAFSTFAYYRIRGAMFDGMRRMGWRGQSSSERRQARFEDRANLVLQQAADDAPAPGSANEAESIENAISQVATAYVVTVEAETLARLPDRAPGPEARAVARDEEERVGAALGRLPEKERRLIELMYFEEKSLTDAGAAIGLSKSWACRLHARALRLLSEEMQRLEAGATQRTIAADR